MTTERTDYISTVVLPSYVTICEVYFTTSTTVIRDLYLLQRAYTVYPYSGIYIQQTVIIKISIARAARGPGAWAGGRWALRGLSHDAIFKAGRART